MQDPVVLFYSFGGLIVVTYIIPNIVKAWITRSKLSGIPTIGPSGFLSSYLGAYRFFFNARDIIQEGYNKYPGAAFKVATLSKWIVVVNGPRMVDDIRRATDDQLSFSEAVGDSIQEKYTIGLELRHDPYHVATVRSPLTRNLAIRFSEIQDEIASAFMDFVPLSEGYVDWIKIPALQTIMKIVCRTSNRLFVGLPLCRNPDYRTLNEEFTVDVIKGAQIITKFPNILKPLAAYLFTNVEPSIKRAIIHLGPIIQDRLDKEEEYGGSDWPGKPNDLITWLLDEAPSHARTIRDVTLRVLTINFAAIHTTSMAFTHALYDLAMYPSYVPALREEVEAIVDEEGLNKVALGKMRKLDSFIKESQRVAGTGALIMDRKTLKDFTFSNGIVVPAGHTIAVALFSTHHDGANYINPEKFDAFRFAQMRELEGEGIKHQMVSLSPDFVAFGMGRHACPGRFFAVNELKAMLAHVLLNYDVKLEEGGVRPPDKWFAQQSMPNPTASVMFRKRSVNNI